MAAMTMVQALNSAIDVMLGRDPDVVVFGEDVGFYGGVFRVTEGLQKKHGEKCRDQDLQNVECRVWRVDVWHSAIVA